VKATPTSPAAAIVTTRGNSGKAGKKATGRGNGIGQWFSGLCKPPAYFSLHSLIFAAMAGQSSTHIITLVKKDLLLEIRQQYSLYGVLLYVAATIFVVYLIAGQPEPDIWNALFWVVQLFVCVNGVAKSFLQEQKGRLLYFYSIAGARDFIVSKLIFNVILMLVMSLLSLGIFTLLLGNPLEHALTFTGIALLGGLGLSLVFTFLSAIASKTQQQASLVAILGFPVIIPQLLLLARIAKIAFAPVVQAGLAQMVLLLIGFDCLVVILAVILFPFLWKD
jgi:heme exporter protein B